MSAHGSTALSGRGGCRRGGRTGGAGLYGPVGIDGGVAGEHGGGGDFAAAHRLGVPAAEGVTLQRRRLGQGGELTGQIGGDYHGGAHAAAGVQTNGVNVLLFFLCRKGRRHCRTQQAERDQTKRQRPEEFFHKIPRFPLRAMPRSRCGGGPARPLDDCVHSAYHNRNGLASFFIESPKFFHRKARYTARAAAAAVQKTSRCLLWKFGKYDILFCMMRHRQAVRQGTLTPYRKMAVLYRIYMKLSRLSVIR